MKVLRPVLHGGSFLGLWFLGGLTGSPWILVIALLAAACLAAACFDQWRNVTLPLAWLATGVALLWMGLAGAEIDTLRETLVVVALTPVLAVSLYLPHPEAPAPRWLAPLIVTGGVGGVVALVGWGPVFLSLGKQATVHDPASATGLALRAGLLATLVALAAVARWFLPQIWSRVKEGGARTGVDPD